jgi:hypothetical protein
LPGQNPPGDPEEPGKSGVGLRDVTTGGLQSYQEGVGHQVCDVLGIVAAPNCVEGDRPDVAAKENRKGVGIPMGGIVEKPGIG